MQRISQTIPIVISIAALIVSIGAATYTRKQYLLAYDQDQRAQALKRPIVDIATHAIDRRHWSLVISIVNRSDVRIVPIGFAIPFPEGGFIKMKQIAPSGEPVSDPSMNNQTGWTLRGRTIPVGGTGVWNADYEIADAFPARPDVALTLQATIKYLGADERDETLKIVRRLNLGS